MKQTEIGLIPEDWEVTVFENFADKSKKWSITGGPFGSNLKTDDYTSDGVQIIQLQNIGDGVFNNKSQIFTSIKKANELLSCNIYPQEIILSKMGDPVARACLIPNHANRFLMASDGIRLVVNEKIFSKNFVFQYINSKYFRSRAIDISTGSTRQRIGLPELKNLKVIIPPLVEQEAIATALSDCDMWIKSLEQVVGKKRLIKQSAMQELLAPKDDWEVKKLGEVIDVFRGGSPRPIQNYISNKLEGINWIKIGDTSSSSKFIVSANEKIIFEGEKMSRRVYPGDFLLSNSMSFGRPYILKIDGCIHDGWLVLQNYHLSFNIEFLYYLLTSKYIMDQYKSKASGSSVLNLNKELVKSVELLIPPLSEQTRIAMILSDMDEEIEALEQKLNKALQIKQGMMQKLLTGRVRLV
ncbi:restriction endonuclease subunit S [Sphingobacterium kitahiroshimense]|uniref:restriction endonuclease subunit S n=1 Tax=Sphingobacterium kitahiroshimense TaxID=470446 RepID=UPI00320B1169